MQRLDRPVGGLLVDGVVEPGGGVLGIEELGLLELGLGEPAALLLEVSLAEVAADQRVVGIEGSGYLDLLGAGVEIPFADLREAQAQPRQRIGGVPSAMARSKADLALSTSIRVR